jgi:O-antigen ligase
MIALPLMAALPGTDKVVNLLPFIGSTEKENVDYRANLMTNSMIVIQRHPWFGSSNFTATPEMEAMRQGEGIIDIVNTYLRVALEKGFVGLGLFAGFFALTLIGIYRAMRLIPDKESEEHLLGRVLLATLVSVLVMIFTVSSITFIPIVYWSVAAMGVAYTLMVRQQAEGSADSASGNARASPG